MSSDTLSLGFAEFSNYRIEVKFVNDYCWEVYDEQVLFECVSDEAFPMDEELSLLLLDAWDNGCLDDIRKKIDQTAMYYDDSEFKQHIRDKAWLTRTSRCVEFYIFSSLDDE